MEKNQLSLVFLVLETKDEISCFNQIEKKGIRAYLQIKINTTEVK